MPKNLKNTQKSEKNANEKNATSKKAENLQPEIKKAEQKGIEQAKPIFKPMIEKIETPEKQEWIDFSQGFIPSKDRKSILILWAYQIIGSISMEFAGIIDFLNYFYSLGLSYSNSILAQLFAGNINFDFDDFENLKIELNKDKNSEKLFKGSILDLLALIPKGFEIPDFGFNSDQSISKMIILEGTKTGDLLLLQQKSNNRKKPAIILSNSGLTTLITLDSTLQHWNLEASFEGITSFEIKTEADLKKQFPAKLIDNLIATYNNSIELNKGNIQEIKSKAEQKAKREQEKIENQARQDQAFAEKSKELAKATKITELYDLFELIKKNSFRDLGNIRKEQHDLLKQQFEALKTKLDPDYKKPEQTSEAKDQDKKAKKEDQPKTKIENSENKPEIKIEKKAEQKIDQKKADKNFKGKKLELADLK